MHKERLLYLLQQYLTDKATREEVEELFACLEFPESDEILANFLEEKWNDQPLEITCRELPGEDPAWDKMWAYIQTATTKPPQDRLVKQKAEPPI